MHIEWNKVTWYSKLLAVIVFLVVLVIGFKFGELYQQAKDYSLTYSSNLQPTHSSNTSSSTEYNGMLTCVNDSGCPSGDSCVQPGPIMVNHPTPKVCLPPGQAIPL